MAGTREIPPAGEIRLLAFLPERAANPTGRQLTADERATLALAGAALCEADAVVVLMGGKAGRLGETIVATALLEGVFEALRVVGRDGVPVTMFVDADACELFQQRLYRERGWPGATCQPIAAGQRAEAPEIFAAGSMGQRLLIVDLHGEHDTAPPLVRISETSAPATAQETQSGAPRRITTLANLARLAIRSYAARGPLRRYADAIEELFDLPVGSVAGEIAQPRILLGEQDVARYAALAQQQALAPTDTLIMCFFQSVVAAKVYERWDAVMLALCEWAAQAMPGRRLRFLVACGADELHPNGPTQADLAAAFADFTGVGGNALVTVTRIPSLRDLAVVAQHAALTLANDTGPGQLSGALAIPTITPYLPGAVYSRRVWAASLAHRGVTLDPSPFSRLAVEAAVLWNRTDVINAIPPEELAAAARDCLGDWIARQGALLHEA